MRARPSTPPDIAQRVAVAAAAVQGRMGLDLKILNLDGVTSLTDYFLICSGTNARQVQAIAEAVDGKLRADKIRPLHAEGMNHGRWVLLDYGDFVVHIFDEETRDYYSLERLWGDAPDVTGDFCK